MFVASRHARHGTTRLRSTRASTRSSSSHIAIAIVMATSNELGLLNLDVRASYIHAATKGGDYAEAKTRRP